MGELALATGAGDPGTLSTFCAAAAPRPVELFAWLGRGRRCSRRMEVRNDAARRTDTKKCVFTFLLGATKQSGFCPRVRIACC